MTHSAQEDLPHAPNTTAATSNSSTQSGTALSTSANAKSSVPNQWDSKQTIDLFFGPGLERFRTLVEDLKQKLMPLLPDSKKENPIYRQYPPLLKLTQAIEGADADLQSFNPDTYTPSASQTKPKNLLFDLFSTLKQAEIALAKTPPNRNIQQLINQIKTIITSIATNYSASLEMYLSSMHIQNLYTAHKAITQLLTEQITTTSSSQQNYEAKHRALLTEFSESQQKTAGEIAGLKVSLAISDAVSRSASRAVSRVGSRTTSAASSQVSSRASSPPRSTRSHSSSTIFSFAHVDTTSTMAPPPPEAKTKRKGEITDFYSPLKIAIVELLQRMVSLNTEEIVLREINHLRYEIIFNADADIAGLLEKIKRGENGPVMQMINQSNRRNDPNGENPWLNQSILQGIIRGITDLITYEDATIPNHSSSKYRANYMNFTGVAIHKQKPHFIFKDSNEALARFSAWNNSLSTAATLRDDDKKVSALTSPSTAYSTSSSSSSSHHPTISVTTPTI